MTMELSAGAAKRRGAGGWRWSGRIFLLLLLGFTVMPMIWMFITSLKTGFAALRWHHLNPTRGFHVRNHADRNPDIRDHAGHHAVE